MRAVFLVMGLLALTQCSAAEPHLVPKDDIQADALPSPLSRMPASAENGRAIFVSRDGGHCVLCHAIETLDAPFQGNVGPDLTHVGDRLTAGQIRLRIVDYEQVKPGSVMPGYYRLHDLHQIGADYRGKPALTAQAIEDLVAYLSSQKEASS